MSRSIWDTQKITDFWLEIVTEESRPLARWYDAHPDHDSSPLLVATPSSLSSTFG